MRDVWLAIGAMAVLVFTIKSAGPVILGGRELPAWLTRLLVLLPAALLTALTMVQTFAGGSGLVVDARAGGVAAAVAAALLRRSMLVILVVALATTALLRAV